MPYHVANETPFTPTPFVDPREAGPRLGRPMSPSKRRSQFRHQQRRNAGVKARFGKAYADMSPEEKMQARKVLGGILR